MKTKLLSFLLLLSSMGAFAKTGNMGIDKANLSAGDKLNVSFNNGSTNKLFISNTKGITINNAITFNNCIPHGIPTNRAAGLPAGVSLSLKIFLEGNMVNGTSMRTYLQNLYGGGFGPLPNTSPYGAPSNTYADINDPAGAAGAVVDWVVVEVRQASNYGIIAESQSLLLKDDGTIVTPTGAVPTFAAQTGTVRVVIKHRNHLAVMSNDLLNFQTAVSYDFTTALTKAANDFGDPAQMKTEYGVWVMIGGDINLDNSVETLDQNLFHTSLGTIDFPEYFNADINLDANVDILDENILFPNFLTGYYSTITNY